MKLPKLAHVKYVRSRGKVYAYFNTGRKKPNGQTAYFSLPQPGSVGFYDSYAACVAGRNRTATQAYTVAKLCEEYERSAEFAKLAPNSQRGYKVYLPQIAKLLDDAPADEVTRADVQMVLDSMAWPAGKQNLFVAVIGAVYSWGRKRDKTTAQPTKDIGKAETGEWMPWPPELIDKALASDNDRIRLAVALLLYTGQRIGDVCNMRHAQRKGDSIKIVQQKTGKPLTIPLFSRLREELDRYGKRGITLLTNRTGGPVRPSNLREDLNAFCKANGHPTLRPHGLRKSAVLALLGAECSVAQTAAITGQSYQLVEDYARQIDQERMAEAAILKWEAKPKKEKRSE